MGSQAKLHHAGKIRRHLLPQCADLFFKCLETGHLAAFCRRIAAAGYLVLGSAESVAGCAELFDMVRIEPAVVYRVKIK